jgi:hypothetical protein
VAAMGVGEEDLLVDSGAKSHDLCHRGELRLEPGFSILSRDGLLLGEIDYGLLGGICNLRVGATSTVQRVVAFHPIFGVNRVVSVLAI